MAKQPDTAGQAGDYGTPGEKGQGADYGEGKLKWHTQTHVRISAWLEPSSNSQQYYSLKQEYPSNHVIHMWRLVWVNALIMLIVCLTTFANWLARFPLMRANHIAAATKNALASNLLVVFIAVQYSRMDTTAASARPQKLFTSVIAVQAPLLTMAAKLVSATNAMIRNRS
jgi:hypothetical protein